jgi:hypothetical protein
MDVALEDEAEKPYVSAAASLSPHQSVSNYYMVELTKLKEVTRALADLFGLRLPVPFKKQAHTIASDQLAPEPHVTTYPRERVGTSF